MTPVSEGRSLELYFINGRPDGMLTAEVFNWTGHVLMTPRTQIADALSRKEARHTGVYILLGEKDGKPWAYIGEGEDIRERILLHVKDKDKDWFTMAVLVTASNNLNKAHVKYLEARLVKEARLAGRVTLSNGQTPALPGLNEAAKSNLEVFLDYLFMVLPALRVDMFIKNTRPNLQASSKAHAALPRFTMTNKKNGLNATAVLQEGEFIVEAGSLARLQWEGQASENYAGLHEELRTTKVLKEQGDHCVFTQHYAFKSPSAAASVINGHPTSGPEVWRVEGNSSIKYRDWEANQLATTKQEVS
jgi:hypothetical protein